MKHFSLLLCALYVLCGSPSLAPAADKKPNVLLILADDLCADLGCYGAPRGNTSNNTTSIRSTSPTTLQATGTTSPSAPFSTSSPTWA